MRYRALGPIEVVDDNDRTVALPVGRIRAVLGMLVLHANQIVPAERLIDAVWNGRSPATARTQLQGLVSQLRRVLAPDPPRDSVLSTHGPGYLLRVEPGEYDAELFHAMLARARQAQADGDLEGALTDFTAALSLCRGRAFDGIACDVLHVEATRVDQLRLLAGEACARLELDVGRPGEAAARLVGLVEEYPLHESIQELSILALYRSGRRAEALTAYRQARQKLVDDLGVEPGHTLHDLHQRMLTDDPSLLQVRSPGALAAAPRPAQLPADLMDFTGREGLVKELSDLYTSPAQSGGTVVISAITAAGGMGKTCLAVHVAHQVRERFPDGQLFVNLGGGSDRPLAAGDVLARLLRDLGVEGASIPVEEGERAARYRSLLAERRMLIVLDNASDAAQVRPLLPGGPGCAVLVTSRSRLAALAGSRAYDLNILDAAEATALFRGIVGPDRTAAEPEATDDVVAFCGGFPLAIRIAGMRLAIRQGWSIRTLARRLADERRRLGELHVDDLAVRASFHLSYRALSESSSGGAVDSARTFRLLGLMAMPSISLDAACALVDMQPSATEAALEALVDAHLLETPGLGRYRLHDLLRLYAGECAADEPEQAGDRAVLRLLTWYLHRLAAACQALDPRPRRQAVFTSPATQKLSFPNSDLALAWCEAERENLLVAVDHAADRGMHELAHQLATVLHTYLDRRWYTNDLRTVSEIGLRSARLSGDRFAEADTLNHSAIGYERLDQLDLATDRLRQSLDIRRELGDRGGEAAAWGNLGNTHLRAQNLPEAHDCMQRALAIASEIGHRSYQSTSLSLLGRINNERQQFDEALEFCLRSLTICQEGGDPFGEGLALIHLGRACHGLKRHQEATSHYRKALAINRRIRSPYNEGMSLLGLGDVFRDLGQERAAKQTWHQALLVFTDVDERRAAETRIRLAGTAG